MMRLISFTFFKGLELASLYYRIGRVFSSPPNLVSAYLEFTTRFCARQEGRSRIGRKATYLEDIIRSGSFHIFLASPFPGSSGFFFR